MTISVPSEFLFISRRLPVGSEVGGGQRVSKERRACGAVEVAGWLSERVKACSQTVGETFAVHSYRCL